MEAHPVTRCHLALASLGLVVGCSEPAQPSGPGEPILRILSGGIPTDSANRLVGTAIRVEVRRRDGTPAAGVEVRYDGGFSGSQVRIPFLLLYPIGGQDHAGSLVDTTDDGGRSAIRARRGHIAGPGMVRISVPSLALKDSIPFAILLGPPFGLAIQPADTALLVGAEIQLAGFVFDNYGNADSAVTFATDSAAVSLAPTGRLQAARIGRAAIRATGGGLSSTAFVSVVPPGTLAAWDTGDGFNGTTSSIVTFRTDGAGFRTVASFPIANHEIGAPAWSPDGTAIAFHGANRRLQVVPSGGGAVRNLLPGTSGFDYEWWPQYSHDGAWIYFVLAQFNGGRELWRVRPDGLGAESLGLSTSAGIWDTEPSPSPDGRSLLFATNREQLSDPREWSIASLDLATDRLSFLDYRGYGPRWSPEGDRIAFVEAGSGISVNTAVKIVTADGLNGRIVSSPGTRAASGISWSPDGRWLAVGGGFPWGPQPILLIDTESGLELPLAFTRTMQQPAWKPAVP